MTRMKERPPKGKDRGSAALSNAQAAVLTGILFAVAAAMIVAPLLRPAESLQERHPWTKSVAWNPSWPALPALNVARGLRLDEARALYAAAGSNAAVLTYIPCYCGCQSEGHRSNHDCYVSRRSADGQVTEWNSHGTTCPVGPDITGDVMLWRENGTPLSTIRTDIEREYGSRGPPTPTPGLPPP
jgi:hypothetical protein